MLDAIFGGMAPWFTAPALLGTGYLVMQLVLGQIGGDMDADADFDADFDDPGAEGRWLSMESIAAFLVGFGWIGLSIFRFTNLQFAASALCGVAAGIGVAWMVVSLTRQAMKLQSTGNLELESTVGHEAPVYISIPPSGAGTGRITLILHQTQHEISARQNGAEPIASNTMVRIIAADATTGMVVVEPA